MGGRARDDAARVTPSWTIFSDHTLTTAEKFQRLLVLMDEQPEQALDARGYLRSIALQESAARASRRRKGSGRRDP